MATIIPVNFQKAGTPQFINYDFFDYITGVGYKDFYGVNVRSGATGIYTFTTRTDIVGEGEGVTASTQSEQNRDFELIFNRPTTINGDAFISAPIGVTYNTSSADTLSGTITLYYTKDGVETQIGQSAVNYGSVSYDANKVGLRVLTGKFNFNKIRFKAGDKIRLNVAVGAVAANHQNVIYHDPSNTTIDANDTGQNYSVSTKRLIMSLPVKILK